MINKVLLNITHHAQAEFRGKDAGILALVLFQDICLYGAADIFQRPVTKLSVLSLIRITLVFPVKFFYLLIYGSVKEHRQDCWRRAIDGHGHRGGRITEIKTIIQCLHVIQCCN